MSDLLRVYSLGDCDENGYPLAWHRCPDCNRGDSGCGTCHDGGSIKGLVRDLAGNRCVRCKHPYITGAYENGGEWSRCDRDCRHGGPARYLQDNGTYAAEMDPEPEALEMLVYTRIVEARWRILTVHHLTGAKADCRWFNLVPLCQRDHLEIQGRVDMHRPWPWEHSEWMKPYVAGFYAAKYGGEDLSREQTMARLPELLEMGAEHERVERMPA